MKSSVIDTTHYDVPSREGLVWGCEGWRKAQWGDFGTDVCTRLYLKWITNKDLLYSTGDSAQCYVAARTGGEFGGEWVRLCTAESLHCPPETITTLLIGCTPIQNKI